jgi:hypothetical protein
MFGWNADQLCRWKGPESNAESTAAYFRYLLVCDPVVGDRSTKYTETLREKKPAEWVNYGVE